MPDAVFLALASPVRRRLLELLVVGPRSAGELAGEFAVELSRPAVAEHLAVLRKAGLVSDRAEGRHRIYRITAEPLAEIGEWLVPFERYWRHTLRDLASYVEQDVEQDVEQEQE